MMSYPTKSISLPTPLVPYNVLDNYDTHNVPADKLYCECGESEKAIIIGIHDNWALWLVCPSQRCRKSWYVCNQCPNSRSKINTVSSMRRHYRDLHKNKRAKIQSFEKQTIQFEEMEYCTEDDWAENENGVVELQQEEPKQEKEHTSDARFDVDCCINWLEMEDTKQMNFAPGPSQHYFANCHQYKDGEWGGVQYLVRRSVVQSDLHKAEMEKIEIPRSHCELHMKIARLAFLLSKKEWGLLTNVLNSVWNVGCEDGYNTATNQINDKMNCLYMNDDLDITPNFVKNRLSSTYNPHLVKRSPHDLGIPIPSSSNDIRKYYMEGKYSVVQNIPCPPISRDVASGHSYVSIIECIRDFFAHCGTGRVAALDSQSKFQIPPDGTVTDTISSRHVLSVIERSKTEAYVREKKPLICLLFFWTDDWEPNAMSKSGRGSAWIKTMTILTRKEDGQRATHTYPIALGKKGESHEEVEAAINNEMELIRNGVASPFYDGNAKKLLHLFFDVHATLQDQPERRSANGLANGAAKFSARWGVSGDHAELYEVLQCCEVCLKRLEDRYCEKQTTLPILNCKDCLCWDILAPSELAKNTLPKDYPTTHIETNSRLILINGAHFLRPFKISYDGLKVAVTHAHNNFLEGNWSAANCSAFLKVEGLNDAVIKTFLEHAVNASCLDAVLSDTHRQIIEQARQKNPILYERMPYLKLWDRPGIDLCTHPDVIMHLLFLGMVRTVVFTVKKWLTCLGKNQTFVNANAKLLSDFKNLSLDWLRILPFSGEKLGAWVSENYLGFSRIMLWFYQNIEEAAVVVDNEPPENLPQNKWLLKHNKHWLKVRGLDTNGKASELSKRVAGYLTHNPVPEKIPHPERKIEDVQCAILSMTRLLRCVMADFVTDESIMETDYCVRIFLSRFAHLSETTWTPGEKKEPKVISSYNLICLMNLPATMQRYGPLRDLWEGSIRGEGFLREAKQQILHGFKLNWQTNLHRNILLEKSFQNIEQGCSMEGTTEKMSHMAKNARNIHAYQSSYEVQEIMNELNSEKKRPLSAFLVRSEHTVARMFVKIGTSDSVVQISLQNDDNNNIVKFGLAYFGFQLQYAHATLQWATDVEPMLGDKPEIIFVVLLPLLEKDQSAASRKFAVVSSTWKNLEPNQTLDSLFSK